MDAAKTFDVLLFTSGDYLWGVDVHFINSVKWGVGSSEFIPLKNQTVKSILGVPSRFGLKLGEAIIPVVPFVGNNDPFGYDSFQGAVIFFREVPEPFGLLADQINGTESLMIREQIRPVPLHLKRVFSGKNIWAIAEAEGGLAYLFEPVYEPEKNKSHADHKKLPE
ncbi:hypothetical protein BMS3Abin05_01264 [bacterium BMS3Abin05]|nr:hypothetical protein BMS3Abin05_01264 [bacterium BMS3Abin05]GBE28570.1 hypothetical protein BMS3Bbin03_02518 [bacterium BMS3Bbin03]HDL78426.1 hypothetical protein [Bacteroidota bacterium]HDZ12582.1 hypothetical protein [Bacteroidota bacterium]